MNLVDKENLARTDVSENPGEVELLLQDWSGGLLELDFQLLGNNGGQRGFAQTRRPVEQHVIHGLATAARCFDGDGQVLFEIALSGEIGKTPRPQPGFELRLFF